MRHFLTLLVCCSGLLAQSPLMDPTSWVWGGRDPDLTFEWHCESTTAEFSLGDTAADLNSECVITNDAAVSGSYSLGCPSSADYAVFTNSPTLINDDEGTVTLWARVTTEANTATFWGGYGSASNLLFLRHYTGQKVRFVYEGADAQLSLTTTNDSYSLDTWFPIVAKWRRGGAGPYMSLQINGGEVYVNSTSDLTDFNQAMPYVRVGEFWGVGANEHIDDLYIYRRWRDDL